MHLNPIIHTSVRLSSYGINLASQTAIRYPPYGSLSYSHIFYSFNHLALQWVGGSSLTSTLFHLTNLPADVLTRLYLDPIPKKVPISTHTSCSLCLDWEAICNHSYAHHCLGIHKRMYTQDTHPHTHTGDTHLHPLTHKGDVR